VTYPQTVKYLETFIDYEKTLSWSYEGSLELKRFRDFLKALGNPQVSFKSIHIAGSKGKGSTCAFIAYILREAGFKTGLYTSPHLSDFRERIRILSPKLQTPNSRREFEGMISRQELARIVAELKPEIESYNRRCRYGPLTFFEVCTALAFIYFKKEQADFAVLETGLGGRLDATNAVEPVVSAITPVSYEHTDKLGKRLRDIAAEKAGIIKSRKLIVISSPQAKEAEKIIKNKSQKEGARLRIVGKDIKINKKLKIKLLGAYQIINANVALAVINALRGCGVKISAQAIKKGLSNTRWPARCEVISERPLVVIDGAQNAASAAALKKAVRDNFRYNKLILVLGVCSDKDIAGIAKELSGLADKVILTKSSNPRAAGPQMLSGYFSGRDKYITDSVREAKKKAESVAGRNDLILVTGSLFVAGEYRYAYGKSN